MQTNWFNSILGGAVTTIPVVLVWLAGLVIAVIRWRRHPRVSLLAVLGLGILVLELVASIIGVSTLPLLIHTQTGMDFNRIAQIAFLIRVGEGVVSAIGWGLVIAAVFAGRR